MQKHSLHRRRRIKKNSPGLDTVLCEEQQVYPTTLELTSYTEKDVKTIKCDTGDTFKTALKSDFKYWLSVKGFSDDKFISRLCKEIGLHIFDIRDLLSEQKVVKVVIYEDAVFIVTSAFKINEEQQLEEIKIAFALGKNFIVSFQDNNDPIFVEARNAIQDNALGIREQTPDFLLYVFLNAINSLNLSTILQMEDELLKVEDQLINQINSRDIQQLMHLRRISYMQIKRSLLAFREEYVNLANHHSMIHPANMIYFHNYDDRVRASLDNLESYHELLISLSDVYYNNTNLIMNEIIKRLTIVSTLFIPLTFLVGVWGMNFKLIPELDWKYGYLFAWICFLAIGISIFFWMKKKKWF